MITTREAPPGDPTAVLARAALDRATRLLLSLQHEDGCWREEESFSLDALTMNLLVRDMLGVRTQEQAEVAATLIRSRQLPGGGWAEVPGGPADPAVTIQSYAALRLAGDGSDAYHMALAAGWIRDAGGLPRAGLISRLWLAHVGAQTWDDIPVITPVIPGEAAPWPASGAEAGPGSAWLERAGRWARTTAAGAAVVVPLGVIGSVRRARKWSLDLGELTPPDGTGLVESAHAGAAMRIDGLLRSGRRYVAKAPPRPSQAALRRCGPWMLARQRADGSWSGTLLATSLSLIALAVLGYDPAHPALDRGLAWLDRLAWPFGAAPAGVRPAGRAGEDSAGGAPAADQSAADTALAMAALTAAGFAPDHPALARAAAFLRRAGQSARGGPLLPSGRIRSADQDRSAIESAEALAALTAAGLARSRRARHYVARLLLTQRGDGSWAGQHGWNDTVVTAAVARALIAAGVQRGKPSIRRALDFVVVGQGSDGDWRSGVSSDHDRTVVGTAVAVRALVGATGSAAVMSVERGARWLAARQRDAGGGAFDREPRSTGLAVSERRQGPALCDLCHPMLALGEYLSNKV